MNDVVSIVDLRLDVAKQFRLDVSEFHLNRNETVAIVGRNGAGKTTLMNAIAGLVPVKSWRGHILGVNAVRWPSERTIKSELGVQLQNLRQHPALRVSELLRLHEVIYRNRNQSLRDALGVNELGERRYGVLSQGQRRRVNLYLAMAHEPRLLLLDEPTADIDERYRGVVRSLIDQKDAERAPSILFTTHLAEDLAIADRVVWLRDGKVEANGSLADLTSRYLAPFKGIIDLKNAETSPGGYRERLNGLARVVLTNDSRRFVLFGPREMQESIAHLVSEADVEGYSYGPTRPSDFLALITGAYGEHAHYC